MSNQLGISLRRIRKQQNLSQKEVSSGICAQSMLSAIESGKYMPNARLLLSLCDRLSIRLDEINLNKNFLISDEQKFNDVLSKLCNQHKYAELKDFLLDTKTIDKVQTTKQTQAYYYYLGVASFQVDSNLKDAEQNLKLSISSNDSVKTKSTLTRMGLVTLGFIQAKRGLPNQASALISKAMENVDEGNYEENLNIIFYLAALASYELKNLQKSLKWIENGITYITSHDSHYMLANLYRLLAQIAEEDGQIDRQLEARRQSDFLKKLFNEKVNENF